MNWELNQILKKQKKFYTNFQPWLQKRFNVRTSNSWANIILLFCRDEKEAFDCFFELLDEFLQDKQFLEEDNQEIKKSKW